jgi:hypothetical protein
VAASCRLRGFRGLRGLRTKDKAGDGVGFEKESSRGQASHNHIKQQRQSEKITTKTSFPQSNKHSA